MRTLRDRIGLLIAVGDETAYYRCGSEVINLSTIKENMPEYFV